MKKKLFKTEKQLPKTTLIILTRNNQEELKRLLHYLKTLPLFQTDVGQIIIVDRFSFDHTKEVGSEFQHSFANEILYFKQKSPRQLFEYLHPYLSDQIIQVINLASISDENKHLPSNLFAEWYQRYLQLVSIKKRDVDTKKIIHQLESDRKQIYDTLQKNVIEPLVNLQMILREDIDHMDEEEILLLLKKFTGNLQTTMQHFDPSLFLAGDSLYANVINFIEDFSTRTQIECFVKEKGTARSLEQIAGLNFMRMMKQAFDFIEHQTYTENVDMKIRWGMKNLYLAVKGTNTKVTKTNWQGKDKELQFIVERAMLLNGKVKFYIEKDQSFTLLIVLPLKECCDKTSKQQSDDDDEQ